MTKTAIILATYGEVDALVDRPTDKEAQMYIETCLRYANADTEEDE